MPSLWRSPNKTHQPMRPLLTAILFLAAMTIAAVAQQSNERTLATKVESAYKQASYDDLSKLIVWHFDPSMPGMREAWEVTTRNQLKREAGKSIHADFHSISTVGSKYKYLPVPQIEEPLIGYVIVTVEKEEKSWYPWAVIKTAEGARLVAAPWKFKTANKAEMATPRKPSD